MSRHCSKQQVNVTLPFFILHCRNLVHIFLHQYRHSRSAADIRKRFADYFYSSVGEVNWQYSHINVPGLSLPITITIIIVYHYALLQKYI